MIKAVTIDFWGTLSLDGPGADEDYRRPRLLGIARALAAAGVPVGANDLDSAYEGLAVRLREIWKTQRDVSIREHVRILLETVHPALPARVSPEALDRAVDAYASPALLVPPAFDRGAKAALEELAGRGLALCLVSNIMRTPGSVLRQLLDREGLLGLFRVVTFSDECGIRKPSPEIFRLTLAQVDVAPAEAVHVGDDPVLDVAGAKGAGLRAIHLLPRGRSRSAIRPDALITEMSELPAALRGLRP